MLFDTVGDWCGILACFSFDTAGDCSLRQPGTFPLLPIIIRPAGRIMIGKGQAMDCTGVLARLFPNRCNRSGQRRAGGSWRVIVCLNDDFAAVQDQRYEHRVLLLRL